LIYDGTKNFLIYHRHLGKGNRRRSKHYQGTNCDIQSTREAPGERKGKGASRGNTGLSKEAWGILEGKKEGRGLDLSRVDGLKPKKR